MQALSKLSREQKHLEDTFQRNIDRYRDSINNINNPITEEVCYSINQLFFHEGQLEDPLMTDEYLFNLIELAYQNDCGDVSVSNYAWFLIWSDEYRDYQKAFEILANALKNAGGVWNMDDIVTFTEMDGIEENKYIAYILHQYKALNTYETLSTYI